LPESGRLYAVGFFRWRNWEQAEVDRLTGKGGRGE